MPSRSQRKASQQFCINLLIGCLTEIATYVRTLAEMCEAPPEVLKRLNDISTVLPGYLVMDNMRFTDEEMERANRLSVQEIIAENTNGQPNPAETVAVGMDGGNDS